jgi:hypothetical protein
VYAQDKSTGAISAFKQASGAVGLVGLKNKTRIGIMTNSQVSM